MKDGSVGLARGPLLNACLFQVFNTSSFYLIMGLPMMLYFKKLGASATVLGVVASELGGGPGPGEQRPHTFVGAEVARCVVPFFFV